MDIEFLQITDVLYIHQNQINEYGGEHGVRDLGLLESAIAQPQAGFGDQYFHSDVFEMASAYLFHIVSNHPFLDGNKRTGAVAALAFLEWNGVDVRADNDALVDITLRVATSNAGKEDVAASLRNLSS